MQRLGDSTLSLSTGDGQCMNKHEQAQRRRSAAAPRRGSASGGAASACHVRAVTGRTGALEEGGRGESMEPFAAVGPGL